MKKLSLALAALVAVASVPAPALATAPRSAARPASARFAGSYEAAMRLPVHYDLGPGARQGGLSDREVAAPLAAALPRLVRCVAREQSRGGELGQVRLRVAVASTGGALGVTVDDGSPAFRTCVRDVVRGLRWQAFEGPRMGFSWSFSVE